MEDLNDWVDVPVEASQGKDDWVDVPVKEPGFFEEGGTYDATLKGAANTLTFGYSPEIIAYGKSKLGGKSYDEELKDYQDEIERAKAFSPTAYDVGSIGGMAIGTGAAVGKTIIKGGQAAAPILKEAAKKLLPIAKDSKTLGFIKDLGGEVAIESITGIPGLGSAIKYGKELYKNGKISKKVYDTLKPYMSKPPTP